MSSIRTGVFQSSNNACIRLFGYAPDEVLDQERQDPSCPSLRSQ